jgi:hypothetical protein
MLWQIAWFEIRYWLRSWMLWIFTLIISAMFLGAVSSDNITIGSSIGNTYRNAPFVIENYYAMIGLLTLLMATAFVNSAAAGFHAQHLPDHLLDAAQPPRFSLRAIHRRNAGVGDPHGRRLDRHAAREIHAVD